MTRSQFSLNLLLSTISAGVRSVLISFPTNSLTKASFEGSVRSDKGVVVCIVLIMPLIRAELWSRVYGQVLRICIYSVEVEVDYREVAGLSGGVGTADLALS